MQEDDIEMEDEVPMSKRWVLLIVFLACIICVGFIGLLLRGGETMSTSVQVETPRQAYLNIIGESHTGLRLARLDDFVVNMALNDNTETAKVQRDALSANEQMAWAKLTISLYDLKNSEADKVKAFAVYKDIWGVWSRQDDLPKLLDATQVIPGVSAQLQYAPNGRKSKFSRDNEETILAGGAPAIIVRPSVKSAPSAPSTYVVQKARIKYAKRPRYPRKARRKGVEAMITLSLDIDERGNVARAHMVSIKARKYQDKFIRAAKRAAMASKFHPKTIGGKPVASSGYVRQYTFRAGE